MKTKKSAFLVAIALLIVTPFLPAQQAQAPPDSPPKVTDIYKPTAFYRLEFTIREMEGEKSLNTSNYILLAQAGSPAKMTAGSQVPYPTSPSNTAYRSIGVSITCTLKETDENPWLSWNIDISGLSSPGKAGDTYPPIFRSTNLSSEGVLTAGRSIMLGSVDDPGTKHRLQVYVTVTKFK